MTVTAADADARVERARISVAVVFALSGLVYASWISRIPAVRDALALSEYRLGLLLLCLSSGAVIALPLAGPLVQRWGPRLVVLAAALTVAAGLVALAGGIAAGSAVLAGAGLVACGLGVGWWDVGMNVEGADVERRLDTRLMPQLHALFSLGSVAGALLGAAASAAEVALPQQLVGTALVVVVVMLPAVRAFLAVPPTDTSTRGERASALTAWREPRTLLIGMLVLAFAFTEGSANDWLAIALVDGHGTSDTVAALGFGVFVAAMTLVRLSGGAVLRRWRPVPLLRISAVVAMAGLLLVVFAPVPALALVGALLWGAGAALGFPLGMSAAGADPGRAAARIGVVSAIGYTAFVAGPPLIGFLAEAGGVLHALLVVLAALSLGLPAAGAVLPAKTSDTLHSDLD